MLIQEKRDNFLLDIPHVQERKHFNSDIEKQPIFLPLNQPLRNHLDKWAGVMSKLKYGSLSTSGIFFSAESK